MTGARAAATATAIEDAALDLVLERGYDSVTVDLICERVGVSQRTFFNHFPTKEDAVLGRDLPEVDERAARRFVLSDGPLLVEAISLISLPADATGPRRTADRMKAISGAPPLLIRQMERIAAIESELREVIGLRLEHTRPERSADERDREASLTTHLLAGVMRWIGSRAEAGDGELALPDAVDQARATLERMLRDSAIAVVRKAPADAAEASPPAS